MPHTIGSTATFAHHRLLPLIPKILLEQILTILCQIDYPNLNYHLKNHEGRGHSHFGGQAIPEKGSSNRKYPLP